MAEQRPPEVKTLTEYPELGETKRPYVPAKHLNSEYPLIDSDPHIARVLRYARTSDYLHGLGLFATGPLIQQWMEFVSPSDVPRKGQMRIMRVNIAISAFAGFYLFYCRSINRFYGFSENRREIDMDMREMTDKVKRGQPLYGTSTLTEYMQGVSSRQSRYAGTFMHVFPWFNLVNHNHHGVDTAKYYRQAERELEAEGTGGAAP